MPYSVQLFAAEPHLIKAHCSRVALNEGALIEGDSQ